MKFDKFPPIERFKQADLLGVMHILNKLIFRINELSEEVDRLSPPPEMPVAPEYDSLTQREKLVCAMCDYGYELGAIGKRFGVTRERIHQIELKARRKLKKIEDGKKPNYFDLLAKE